MRPVYDRLVTEAGARAVALLEELVAIPSVTGDEARVMDFLAARLRQGGLTVETPEVSPGRHNLFARSGGPADVVFTTHADTVPPFFPPRREGSILQGRGVPRRHDLRGNHAEHRGPRGRNSAQRHRRQGAGRSSLPDGGVDRGPPVPYRSRRERPGFARNPLPFGADPFPLSARARGTA